MKSSYLASRVSVLSRVLACLVLALTFFSLARAAGSNGTLSGTVSNAATGNLLEGARVELPRLQLSTLVDETGSYSLDHLPAGTHEVVVSYIGLDPVHRPVTISAGQRAVQNFDLTTGIYQMAQFRVIGEREGDASAITAQRNAQNLKNVTATDSFGNLPNMNAGEVALRLPGVYGELDPTGNIVAFTIRGMGPGLNSVTMDGALMTGLGGLGRAVTINTITAAMLDQVELIKGHTPDKGAESLGGTLNLKTRSPLSLREKRRVTYSLSARVAPPFTQQIPLREEHRVHGLGTVTYQEVFDVLGGARNLGVVVNVFTSETALGWFTSQRDFQNTATSPAFIWDYRTGDVYNVRSQKNINAKVDYRLSPATKLSFAAAYVDHSEMHRRQYDVRAFTGTQNQDTVPNATNSSIVPGYTDRVTVVRPVANSVIDITSTGPTNYFNRLRRVDLGAEHTWGPWAVDYNARYSQTHINIGYGDGASLINRIASVGWILDRTESDLFPKFIQNGGPDFTNPANYRPAPNGLVNANSALTHEVKEATANFRYTLPVRAPVFAKTGFQWREQVGGEDNASRRWSYIGATALPADPSLLTMDRVKTGRNMPQWEASHFIHAREVVDPTLWREDNYYREAAKYSGASEVVETVTAAYAMLQGRLGREGWLGRTDFLGGVRAEKTENEIAGWIRNQTLSSVADQQGDPAGSALRDFGNFREIDASYTKAFPSVHLSHDVTENLKARLSWSTSFGRPAFNALTPSVAANETARTVTVSNPLLLPQTAENWDATLEYYFEPVGSLSVAWFHKSIDDFIVPNLEQGTLGTGTDNGYNGEYPGYTLLTTLNAGTAVVQGWEFSYQQQFNFLPGLLKGFSVFANYTVLDTHSDFGTRTTLTSGQVAGFVPRTANVSLSWRYRGFSTRVLANYASDSLTQYNATSPARNLYRFSRKLINLGFAYQIRPSLNVTLDIDNLTNVPQKRYRGIPDHVEYFNYPGTTFTVGLSGRF
ncbi:MAG: TonB-dependent receptor [Verrucomicrobiota bacterium]